MCLQIGTHWGCGCGNSYCQCTTVKTVCGSCPHCGAPLYQTKSRWGVQWFTPQIEYTCSCRLNQVAQVIHIHQEKPQRKSLAKKKSNAQW